MNLLYLNIGSQEIIMLLILIPILFFPLICMILAFIDLAKRDFDSKTTDKILLIALILFAPVVGSLIYYTLLRKQYPYKKSPYQHR